MNFGTRLRELREDNDLNQTQIGKLLGVSGRMVSYYEKGTHLPREASSIVGLSKYFNVSTDYLFGLSNTKNFNEISQLFKSYEALSIEGQKELINYLEFLNTKYKVK